MEPERANQSLAVEVWMIRPKTELDLQYQVFEPTFRTIPLGLGDDGTQSSTDNLRHVGLNLH